jgi:hypothetical protein
MAVMPLGGCVGEVDPLSELDDEPALFADDGQDGADEKADQGGLSCDLQASLGAAAGVIVTGGALTAGCAGILAVTGPGEILCVAPAAGTALATVVAGLAGVGTYLVCSINSQKRTVPLTQSNSSQCRLGSPQFCRNLTAKYKNYCGKDVFSPTSQISCEKIDLRPATATAAKCTDVKKRIELSTGCLTGRRMMQNFVDRGICPGSPDDPTGDGHWQAIQRANDALAECKSKYRKACGGPTDQHIQAQTAKDFARAVYQCQ